MLKSLGYIKYILLLIVGVLLWLFFQRKTVENIDTSNARISKQKAFNLANELYTAMDKLGTDEDLIKKVFTGLSPDDFKLVYKEFGLRGYFMFNSLDYIGFPYNLVQWLREEIGNDIEIVNKTIRDAGFTY